MTTSAASRRYRLGHCGRQCGVCLLACCSRFSSPSSAARASLSRSVYRPESFLPCGNSSLHRLEDEGFYSSGFLATGKWVISRNFKFLEFLYQFLLLYIYTVYISAFRAHRVHTRARQLSCLQQRAELSKNKKEYHIDFSIQRTR